MKNEERNLLKQNILALLSSDDCDTAGEELTSAFLQYIDKGAGATLEYIEAELEKKLNEIDAPTEQAARKALLVWDIELTQAVIKKSVNAERRKFLKKLKQVRQRISDARDRQEIPEDVTEDELTVYFSQFLGDETTEDIPEAETVKKAAEQIKSDRAVYDGIAKRFIETVNGNCGRDEKKAVMLKLMGEALQHVADNMDKSIHQMSNAEENDIFLFDALTVHPENAAAAADISKAVLTRAARTAALYLTSCITAAVGMEPAPAKPTAEIGKSLQAILSCIYNPEDTTKDVLDTLPKTLEYLREHAPELAADLEAHARREVKAAFSSLTEYVENYGREPVGGKAEPAAILQTLPTMKRVDGTDKLTQAVFGGKVSTDLRQVAMEPAGSPKEVTSAICLLNYDGFTLPNGQPLVLNPFLYEVYNAVCSIRAAGNRYTTYNMIYKVMTGKTGRGKSKEVALSSTKKESIRKALQILRVGVSVDIHEEVDAGYIKDEKLKGTRFEKLKDKKKRPAYLDDVLLDTRVIGNVNIDGHMMDEVIEIKDEPILYSYSKMRGQVSTYPLEVLNAPIRNTADNMAVRGILIRWILMGDKKKDFYKLNYEKIFEAVGISAADKSSGTNKRRTQIRKCVDDCLIYWKKIDFIRDYTVNRRGAKYVSITVTTPEQIEQRKQIKQSKKH